jgi:hypothetical protein
VSDGVAQARRILAIGAGAVATGLVVAGTVSPTAGGAMVVAGWLALVWGLHRFGRTGPADS